MYRLCSAHLSPRYSQKVHPICYLDYKSYKARWFCCGIYRLLRTGILEAEQGAEMKYSALEAPSARVDTLRDLLCEHKVKFLVSRASLDDAIIAALKVVSEVSLQANPLALLQLFWEHKQFLVPFGEVHVAWGYFKTVSCGYPDVRNHVGDIRQSRGRGKGDANEDDCEKGGEARHNWGGKSRRYLKFRYQGSCVLVQKTSSSRRAGRGLNMLMNQSLGIVETIQQNLLYSNSQSQNSENDICQPERIGCLNWSKEQTEFGNKASFSASSAVLSACWATKTSQRSLGHTDLFFFTIRKRFVASAKLHSQSVETRIMI